jgi:hypothetical protein
MRNNNFIEGTPQTAAAAAVIVVVDQSTTSNYPCLLFLGLERKYFNHTTYIDFHWCWVQRWPWREFLVPYA